MSTRKPLETSVLSNNSSTPDFEKSEESLPPKIIMVEEPTNIESNDFLEDFDNPDLIIFDQDPENEDLYIHGF